MMEMLRRLNDVELAGYIRYRTANRMTARPEYGAAVEESGRRHGQGLAFPATIALVREAGQAGRFIAYGELAKRSGVPWVKARRVVFDHLGQLCQLAHGRGWPLLSCLFVNQQHVETGHMEASSLKGFVATARSLHVPVANASAFLKEQQELTFAWARGQAEGAG